MFSARECHVQRQLGPHPAKMNYGLSGKCASKEIAEWMLSPKYSLFYNLA